MIAPLLSLDGANVTINSNWVVHIHLLYTKKSDLGYSQFHCIALISRSAMAMPAVPTIKPGCGYIISILLPKHWQ